MSCLLAILLYTGGISNEDDRLVVMDLAPQRSFYQTHALNKDRWFPSVAHVDDIVMRSSPNKRPGTHMTIYCSQTRSKDSLLRFVTAGSGKSIQSAEPSIRLQTESEAECLNFIKDKIKKTSRKQLANSEITSQNIRTKSIINSLRSKEKIGVVESKAGMFLYDFNIPAASLHEPVKIASVLWNGNFLRLATIDKTFFGLAWYHGFLTVFRMDVHECWSPIQTLSQDVKLENYVLKFLAATSQAVRLIMDRLAESQKSFVSKPEIGQSQENDINNAKTPSVSSLLQVLDQSEFKFTEYVATGFLGKGLIMQRS